MATTLVYIECEITTRNEKGNLLLPPRTTWKCPPILPKGEKFESNNIVDMLMWAMGQCEEYREKTGRIKIPVLNSLHHTLNRTRITLGEKAIERLGIEDVDIILPIYNVHFVPFNPKDENEGGVYFGTVIYNGEYATVCTGEHRGGLGIQLLSTVGWSNKQLRRFRARVNYPTRGDDLALKNNADPIEVGDVERSFKSGINQLHSSILEFGQSLKQAGGSFNWNPSSVTYDADERERIVQNRPMYQARYIGDDLTELQLRLRPTYEEMAARLAPPDVPTTSDFEARAIPDVDAESPTQMDAADIRFDAATVVWQPLHIRHDFVDYSESVAHNPGDWSAFEEIIVDDDLLDEHSDE